MGMHTIKVRLFSAYRKIPVMLLSSDWMVCLVAYNSLHNCFLALHIAMKLTETIVPHKISLVIVILWQHSGERGVRDRLYYELIL